MQIFIRSSKFLSSVNYLFAKKESTWHRTASKIHTIPHISWLLTWRMIYTGWNQLKNTVYIQDNNPKRQAKWLLQWAEWWWIFTLCHQEKWIVPHPTMGYHDLSIFCMNVSSVPTIHQTIWCLFQYQNA